MKARVFLIIATILTVFNSCKNEPKAEEDLTTKAVVDVFKATLNVKVLKDDTFQMYYTEKADENFSEEKSIWVNIKGSEIQQNIVFNLPEDVVPFLVRFDFGLSDAQEDIVLSSIEMDYFGKKFLINQSLMAIYFRPLEQTQFDFSTGILKPTFKDGKRVESVLHPHEAVLSPEIAKIVQ